MTERVLVPIDITDLVWLASRCYQAGTWPRIILVKEVDFLGYDNTAHTDFMTVARK